MNQVANQLVQAFPISKRTFVGIASDYKNGGTILHSTDDGKIEFHFKNGAIVSVQAKEGDDFSLSEDISTITSEQEVWIS